MPFVNREVTPVYLSKKCLPPDKGVEDELEAVSNNTLVGTLKQLATLVRVADDIFSRVHNECQLIYRRSEAVRSKLCAVTVIVDNFDAKKVDIPEGDLESFIRIKGHYKTFYDAESLSRDLFLPPNRPKFIEDLYGVAAETPLHVVKSINQYRHDEKFSLPPPPLPSPLSTLDDKSVDGLSLDIETRKPASLLRAMDNSQDTETDDNFYSSTDTLTPSSKILPSPEEVTKATAEEFPATTVPIDVTGSGFQRMATFRRSLLQIKFLDKRRKKKKSKRRNTICEGDSTLKRQVQDALTQTEASSSKSVKRRSLGMFNLRRKSADMLDSRDDLFQENTLKDEKKCISTSCQTDAISQENVGPRPITASTSALNEKDKSTRSSRFLSGFLRASRAKFHKGSSNSIDKESKKSNTASKRGSGVIPISTLSQAMTVAVKMRDSSRVGKSPKDEDRHSSSGNWSASSSTRTSFDSDSTNKNIVGIPSNGMTYSQCSRDSAVSEKENHVDNGSQDETMTGASGYTSDSTVAGTMSTSSFAFHPNQYKSNRTNMWLRNHTQVNMNSSVDEQTSDGDTTPLVLSPFTRRRSKNSNNATDDESSIYSVDADGYYTSMHTDSGLRSGPLPSPPPLPPLPSKNVENKSVSNNGSEFTNSETICIRKKVTPPAPPKRTSSRPNSVVEVSPGNLKISSGKTEEAVITSSTNTQSSDCSSSSCSETTDCSTINESDNEAGKRLRNKTVISSTKYPSMVHVSESEDDYDQKTSLNANSYWAKAGYIANQRNSGSLSPAPKAMTVCLTMKPKSEGSVSLPDSSDKSNSFRQLNSGETNGTLADSPPSIDIKTITYPVAPTTKSSSTLTSSTSHSQRPNTLNLKNVNISEHDVPMLQKQYSLCKSPVPTLYCDSLLRQKPALKRSQSMKQEQRSPMTSKNHYIITKGSTSPDADGTYPSNSLGRRRNRYQMMNVESTIAAQLPLSKKYSTLPTKLKHGSASNGNDNSLKNMTNGKMMYGSASLDRRSIKNSQGLMSPNFIGYNHMPASPVFRYPVSKQTAHPQTSQVPDLKTRPNYLARSPPPSFNSQTKKNVQAPVKIGPSVAPKPKINIYSPNASKQRVVNGIKNVVSPKTPISSDKKPQVLGSFQKTNHESSPPNSKESKTPKKSTMTAEDLFAAIHNSKRKMNIRTDSCLSPIPSRCTSPVVGQMSNHSSRASTPGCVSPTPSIQSNISSYSDAPRPSGNILAETGFLSPKGGSVKNVAGERRSWAAGSRSTPSPVPNASKKKSFAIDRLRNKKPTSISDFKKLLLQTKTSPSNQRSAAEMLRATSPVPRSPSSSPSPSHSHFKPISPSLAASPAEHKDAYHSATISGTRSLNNRSSSPFKRGNRLRSSLPATSIITSPIWEDSCENESVNSVQVSGRTPLVPKPVQNQSRTYGYLSQSSPSKCSAGEPILHIPTRSTLESSV